MGRPINKKYLGAGTGNQIAAKVWITGEAAAVDGYIVNQRGTKKYTVTDGTATGVCILVNADTPLEGQMIIEATDDVAAVRQVTRLKNRTVTMEGNIRSKWSFAAPVAGIVQLGAPTGDVINPLITIGTQPLPVDTSSGVASFVIAASSSPVVALTYQWQAREGSGAYADISNGVDGNLTYATATTNTLGITGATVAESGWTYRCVVSATSAADVTSDPAMMTFVD